MPPMSSDTLATILGGGQGSRLFPLTATRSKPAVPIGGKYRLIDVPISGCLHADIRRIFVLTQFNSSRFSRRNRRRTTRTGTKGPRTPCARRRAT
jgi:glucose-1-phosphate adenylyltransferase